MKRLVTALVLVFLMFMVTTAALAGTTVYAGPKQWMANEGAGSSYSKKWFGNHFSTLGSGHDKAVTFIDNMSYAWHNTIRNRSAFTETSAPSGLTTKGHCRAYSAYFHGSCWLHH